MENRDLICIGCPLGCPLTVTIENGEVTETDCCYGNCIYQANCPIAKEIDSLK